LSSTASAAAPAGSRSSSSSSSDPLSGNDDLTPEEEERYLQAAHRVKGVKYGTVVSNKMDKTISVSCSRLVIVPKYRNRVVKSRKIFAHDESEEANIGDRVRIVPCNKISKRKAFRLDTILRRAPQL
jgi:small subunit ribosomal protein S17